jgi:hypothetical protein
MTAQHRSDNGQPGPTYISACVGLGRQCPGKEGHSASHTERKGGEPRFGPPASQGLDNRTSGETVRPSVDLVRHIKQCYPDLDITLVAPRRSIIENTRVSKIGLIDGLGWPFGIAMCVRLRVLLVLLVDGGHNGTSCPETVLVAIWSAVGDGCERAPVDRGATAAGSAASRDPPLRTAPYYRATNARVCDKSPEERRAHQKVLCISLRVRRDRQ